MEWDAPETAGSVVGIITSIAQDAVAAAITYRMAKVISIDATSMVVEFADEPDSRIPVKLPSFRPKATGMNVEIEVRNGTEFHLNKVFGDTAVTGTSQPDPVIPDVPTGLALTTSARAVTATWDISDGATAYDVQRAKDTEFIDSPEIKQVIANQISFSGMTPGEGWYFRVRAHNTAGDSEWSSFESIVVSGEGGGASALPAVPLLLKIENGNLSQLASWAVVGGADYYELQFSADQNFQTGNTSQITRATQYWRLQLTVGNTWYYRVRAVNTLGPSDWSSPVSETVASVGTQPAGKPAKILGVALSSSRGGITSLWNPQAVATAYEVQRARNSTFTLSFTSQTVAGSTLQTNNLPIGQTWYYRVRGTNSLGAGDFSDVVSIPVADEPPPANAPDVVLDLKLSSIPTQVTASWASLNNVSKYELQRSYDQNFGGTIYPEFPETNQFTVTGLTPDETFYFRVRGVNDAGNGTWSDTKSITVRSATDYTDGKPPANSPPTSVTTGIGQLIAEWPIQPNADPVIYDVHLGMTSGFTPSAATLLGSTGSTFWVTTTKPDGTKLQAGTTHFMRVVARDRDGAANPGAQGSGVPDVIDLGTAGDVHYSGIKGDGAVPPTPNAPTISGGLGYLYAKWPRPGGADPLTYEVHVSTNANFIPDANTLSLTTTSLFAFIRKQGPGNFSRDLVYGTTYYVRLVAFDVDGFSQPGPANSGFTVQANTADIAVGAIRAGSGIIGDLAVDTAQIADAAISYAKIGDLQVDTAKIANGAIKNAKIDDLAVTTAKINDLAINNAKIDDLAVNSAKVQSLVAGKILSDTLTANVVIAASLRTSYDIRRVEFNAGGIFMIDDYGNQVVALNATNGTAQFSGNVNAVNGSFSGNITSSAVIRGGVLVADRILTREYGASVEVNSGDINTIKFHTQHWQSYEDLSPHIKSGTFYPGWGGLDINSGYTSNMQTALVLSSGSMNSSWRQSMLTLYGAAEDNSVEMFARLQTDRFEVWATRMELVHSPFDASGGYFVQGIRFGASGSFPNAQGRLMHSGAGNGNLHMDTNQGRIYLNWFGGMGHVAVGNGGAGWGVVYAAQFAVTSSRAFKSQIEPFVPGVALTKVRDLVPVYYVKDPDQQATPADVYERHISLVAEDVLKVVPEAVVVDLNSGRVDGLAVSELLAFLVQVVKDLDTSLTQLRAATGKADPNGPAGPAVPPVPPGKP
jgi:hypothetical protein